MKKDVNNFGLLIPSINDHKTQYNIILYAIKYILYLCTFK